MMHKLCILLLCALLTFTSVTCHGGNGHDHDDDADIETTDFVLIGAGPTGVAAAVDLADAPSRPDVTLLSQGYAADFDYAAPEYWPWLADSGSGAGPYPVRGNPAMQQEMATPVIGDTFAARNPQLYPKVPHPGGATVLNGGVFGMLSYEWWQRQCNYVADPVGCNPNVIMSKRAKYQTYTGHISNPACHGTSGGLQILDLVPEATSVQLMNSASAVLGLPIVDLACYNPSQGIGTLTRALKTLNLSAPLTEPWKRWQRQNIYHSLFKPAQVNHNKLHLIEGATATRLLYKGHGSNRKVSGVVYIREGHEYTIKARKEVIVAAGNRGTPEFLLRNGIGPKAVVEKVGIDSVYDQPNVGRHLRDTLGIQTFWAGFPEARIGTSGTESLWTSSLAISRGETIADLELATTQMLSTPTSSLILLLIKANNLEAEGTVTLQSRDGSLHPRIEYPMFIESDYDLMCEAMNVTRRITQHMATQGFPLFETGISATAPTCALFKAAMRSQPTFVQLDYHDVGTVRAGATGDTSAAVNARGKFDGLRGLRVIGVPLFYRANDRHAGYGGAFDAGLWGAHVIKLDHGMVLLVSLYHEQELGKDKHGKIISM